MKLVVCVCVNAKLSGNELKALPSAEKKINTSLPNLLTALSLKQQLYARHLML
jgi:hypothetical protein